MKNEIAVQAFLAMKVEEMQTRPAGKPGHLQLQEGCQIVISMLGVRHRYVLHEACENITRPTSIVQGGSRDRRPGAAASGFRRIAHQSPDSWRQQLGHVRLRLAGHSTRPNTGSIAGSLNQAQKLRPGSGQTSVAYDSDILDRLARSKFRSRFRLSAAERSYANDKGRSTILRHTRDFVAGRLAHAHPRNDGKQTPMRGHPAFVAQHATATCCRSCLKRWHGIDSGRQMDKAEQEKVVSLIMMWIDRQMRTSGTS